MNTNNATCSLTKNSPIATLIPVARWEEIQEVSWTKLQDNTAELLRSLPNNTNLQLEPDTNNSPRSIPDADIPDEAREKLKELLNIKYVSIMSQTAMDIEKTNLIELDIPTEGPPLALKPYMGPLKYHELVDGIKQLEEVGIITRSMNDWASPMLVVPKKEEWIDANSSVSNSRHSTGKFNLRLCINYRKLNSRIQTVCQIKADGSLGKVISNYPLPTIDSILTNFNGCKFSTIDLRSGYYYIRLTKEAAEKAAFVTDMG